MAGIRMENDYLRSNNLPAMALLLLPSPSPGIASPPFFGPPLKTLTDAQARLAAYHVDAWLFDLILMGKSIEDLSDDQCARLEPIMKKVERSNKRSTRKK